MLDAVRRTLDDLAPAVETGSPVTAIRIHEYILVA